MMLLYIKTYKMILSLGVIILKIMAALQYWALISQS